MKTVLSAIRWFYLLYLPSMFLWMGGILVEINVFHSNSWGVSESFGAQFLLGYLMFMCVIAFVVLYMSFEVRQVIISDYSGSYERIYTENWRFMIFPKLKYAWKGYRVFSLFSLDQARWLYSIFGWNVYPWTRASMTNMHFEYYDPELDQIRWHSPYDNFR